MNDIDGDGAFDALEFNNGWGDGGFPLSRGLESRGRTVAVAITSMMLPWRIAVPDGVPPPDVTTEENRIAKCPDDIYATSCQDRS